MKGLTAIVVATALSCAVAEPIRADVIVDGSFELASTGTTTSNSAWTLVENAPAGNGAIFRDSFAASEGDMGVWFRQFDGTPADPANATLNQVIANVTGGDYELYFDAAREEFFRPLQWVAAFKTSGGAAVSIDLKTAVFNLPSNMSNPTIFMLPLAGVAPGEDLIITVQMLDGVIAPNNPQSAFVDNFRLVHVPEPASAMLITALGAGLLLRRRKH